MDLKEISRVLMKAIFNIHEKELHKVYTVPHPSKWGFQPYKKNFDYADFDKSEHKQFSSMVVKAIKKRTKKNIRGVNRVSMRAGQFVEIYLLGDSTPDIPTFNIDINKNILFLKGAFRDYLKNGELIEKLVFKKDTTVDDVCEWVFSEINKYLKNIKYKVEIPAKKQSKISKKWKKSETYKRGLPRSYPNAYIRGSWAVHKSYTGSGWSLTHMPSGLAAFKNVSSDEFLKKFIDVIVAKKPEILKIKDKNKLQKYAVLFSETWAELKSYK